MRKVTDFIIDKRYGILFLFIIFSICSMFLMTKVNINHDIAKYLPKDSETRIGMDIMEKELKEIDSSSFNLMFKGLSIDDKEKIYRELTKIDGVDSVDYDEGADYNRGDYTLYVINVSDTDDSILARDVFSNVKEKYDDYDIYTSGDIADSNEEVLPIWIVVLAVFCALIVLIVMCSSYVEPFLFLTVILIAVLLNDGTNIIFDSVSNITSSISAILQMALSMDYSIMLMSRYSQEKEKKDDKVKAMKEALSNAFSSISSSSITTIVGLLALVFMSFTIGRDLGFVLAKGVLLSLVCIFTCLPALILIFDKFITKTKKKSLNIKLDTLGKFSYRLRKISLLIFVLVFIFSFFTKGSLKILYTDDENNKIKEVFKTNNQMAIVYKNDNEKKMADYCRSLEAKSGVNNVLCYSNTIGEKLRYNELNKRMNDLGSEMDVDLYLLKLIFYKYYNQTEENKITFSEFINFILEDVYKNEDINLDSTVKGNIERLNNFTDVDLINKKRTVDEVASILDMSSSEVEEIFIYYNSLNRSNTITLRQFIDFMNNDVLKSKYGDGIDDSTKNNLKILANFINVNVIKGKMSFLEQADLFGLDDGVVRELYLYYITQNEINLRMKISEFANFTSDRVLNDPLYSTNFDENVRNNINVLKTFSNMGIINEKMTADGLKNIFGMSLEQVKQILYFRYKNVDVDTKMTLERLVTTTIYIKNNTTYLNDVDISKIVLLANDQQLMSDPNLYTASDVASILGVDKDYICCLYSLIDLVNNNTDNWKMTPYEFVCFILDNKDKMGLESDKINNLLLIRTIMDSTFNNVGFIYNEMADLLGIDKNILKSIYSLYLLNYSDIKLSPQEFVSFLLSHKNDSILANRIDKGMVNKLTLLNSVMSASVNNYSYNPSDLAQVLGMNENELKLVFSLYDYRRNPSSISLKELVDFLLSEVVNNDELSKGIDKSKVDKLKTIDGVMNASLMNVLYTNDEMVAILSKLTKDIDQSLIELLYIYYGSQREYNTNWKLSVEEFVNYLNKTIFKDERFNDFIDDDIRVRVTNSKRDIKKAKELLIGGKYSRVVINTNFDLESNKTFNFIKNIQNELGNNMDNVYLIGNSPMAYDMSKTFNREMDFITILTMLAIFIVVAITFISLIIPIILVLLIQCAVYLTMGILSFTGGNVYFIALLIVQSILMGATIDYAILYTSYYIEHRKSMNIKNSIICSYNKSIHTILTSASILIIVTLIVGCFASAIAAKICKTLSQGTLCSALLILILLPAVLALFDRFIIKNSKI